MGLIASVAGKGTVATSSNGVALPDTAVTVGWMRRLHGKKSEPNDSIFFQMAKFSLAPESVCRVTIAPAFMFRDSNKVIANPNTPDDLLVGNYTFENADNSWVGAGIGFGYTNRFDQPFFNGGSVNALILGHFFFWRPENPLNSFSYGLVAGFSLSNLFNHIITGFQISLTNAWTDWSGHARLFFGIDFMNTGSTSDSPRVGAPIIGFYYDL